MADQKTAQPTNVRWAVSGRPNHQTAITETLGHPGVRETAKERLLRIQASAKSKKRAR